jgi:rhodanese-related sulfurtransferase
MNLALRYRIVGMLLMSGVVLSMGSTGCAANITRDELLRWMQEGYAPVIVDVRSRGEYGRDHVPGAVHIPFYSVGAGLKNIGISKRDAVVLYCEHGPRTGFAGLALFLSGYEQVYSLDGHMQGWRANDFPLESSAH